MQYKYDTSLNFHSFLDVVAATLTTFFVRRCGHGQYPASSPGEPMRPGLPLLPIYPRCPKCYYHLLTSNCYKKVNEAKGIKRFR